MDYQSVKKIKITTLVEDTSPKRPFYGEHGLSFLIETDENKILFDTGFSGEALIHNLSALNIDLMQINAFILSHNHNDHGGGLGHIADLIKDKPMYCASNFHEGEITDSKEISQKIRDINYATESKEIFPSIWVSQEKNSINSKKPAKEINLVINLENKGLVIIVGCSHHGLNSLIKDAQQLFDSKIPLYALIGGLHLKDNSPEEINLILDDLEKYNFQIIAPNHCTGFHALKIITEKFKNETNLIKNSDSGTFHTGMSIEL
jgi:7,8-dihydropterin-6-yl-methyl-4-(beta-D-ribofuranosyl)aminobenzene 5'-phosphate synthase